MNCLLIFVPLGIAAGIMEWSAVTVFTLNFLALVPLALILGDVTEDLALRWELLQSVAAALAGRCDGHESSVP